MGAAVKWANEILPEDKPRHLLGIGEPEDLFQGVENGVDTFDCVAPTRIARTGQVYTMHGKINVLNSQFRDELIPLNPGCMYYTCTHYTRSYVAHLFRSKEMLAATLASIEKLYVFIHLVDGMRKSITEGKFEEYKREFLEGYR